ncbi:Hypothetical predicted protein [Octopus vulgaris]|uniref:Uncharacterized protein n=1 Tax=Octopus vulgaris TaxID=6645 RepID=A0AA36AMP3_OCTVU|nr:Hypothetical predicted protein [Octopus vulgaris]
MPKRQKPRQAEDRKWEMFVDKPLPESIVVSALRPDLVLVDEGQRRVVLGEMTVPCEESTAEAFKIRLISKLEVETCSSECRIHPSACSFPPYLCIRDCQSRIIEVRRSSEKLNPLS